MIAKREKTDQLPRRFGRYLLLSRLAGGGMAEVYAARLAEEIGPSRLLVIKILPNTPTDDAEGEVRFLEEARIVLSLTHGNITTAFEFGRDNGRPFLVMEYVPGPSLRQLIAAVRENAEQLQVEDALFVARETLRALSYAHSYGGAEKGGQGIVHRDISPDNILISNAGQVKLTDFGIAQHRHSGLYGPIFGKAEYIAPEVARGGKPDVASDIYSLGTVFYECLTGRPPFRGLNERETLEMVISGVVTPPSFTRPGLSQQIDNLTLRLLSKDPEKRPSTASELQAEMSAALTGIRPSYAEPDLASTVHKYFPPQNGFELGSDAELRANLLAAGIEVRKDQTTGTLLASRTVPLNAPLDAPKERKSRRTIFLGLATLALIILAIWRWSDNEGEFDTKEKNPPTTVTKSNTPPVSDKIQSQTKTQDAGITPFKKLHTPNPRRNAKRGFATAEKNPKRKQPHLAAKNTSRHSSLEKQSPPNQSVTQSENEWGWLNVNTYPWSYVWVDGVKLDGHTPFRKLKLKSGSHVLVFENPELGLKATRKVKVKPWEETSFGIRLK